MKAFFVALLTLLSVSAAQAAERGYSVTDFDRIRVIGPFAVTVITGKGASARATGTAEALQRVDMQVTGRVLTIRANSAAWGGWPGKKGSQTAIISVSTPQLSQAVLSGSGSLKISRMRAPKVTLWLDGSGALSVDAIETDRLNGAIQGSGQMTIGGKAAHAVLSGVGPATMDAKQLTAKAIDLRWSSAGNVTATASQTAKVISTGSGNVMIEGNAACTVDAKGAGTVTCGK